MQIIPDFSSEENGFLFFFFAFLVLVQLVYVFYFFGRLAFFKPKVSPAFDGGISIIIAARNESENLFQHLPFILEQDYPEFEVIVINHQSLDDTFYILDAYKQQYPHLRSIEVSRSEHLRYGKKLPLTLGVKGARFPNMLFTDADCRPASNNWLRKMAAAFGNDKQIVLGYGPYRREEGFLNRLIRFDTAWIAMSYLSFARAGVPYMGIGRNMAYTKEVFDSVSGFKSHYALPSGDDDLFIQEAAKEKNYTIQIDPDSFCFSKAADNWEKWYRQKTRHFSTAERYKVFKKALLGIYPFASLLALVLFIILLFNPAFSWLSLIFYVLLLIAKWVVIGKAFKKLAAGSFVAWIPLWDLAYALIMPVVYYTADSKGDEQW